MEAVVAATALWRRVNAARSVGESVATPAWLVSGALLGWSRTEWCVTGARAVTDTLKYPGPRPARPGPAPARPTTPNNLQ
ncbi:hypothetical protein PtA15_7A17 [Puccinia triticina]|uniref:Uncharacterized protein n=1 Tax=Puccinia triticina TaxID=208348 RepID=A0ABY7CQ81_9BASI|nr:uncharacterized protein PtA15_7A17 [Puccinia triticina]WAQ86291.1 hypothetical protein PtA15_7A17 [Puccinia triticina]WAR56169.1 hypothetical protein PtB15_7B14 [Puccinia triticina]